MRVLQAGILEWVAIPFFRGSSRPRDRTQVFCIAGRFFTVLVAQSCLTLCNPMDCSMPASSVHGIFQARLLEWVAISFSRGSSRPRDRTQVSSIPGRCFNLWAIALKPNCVTYINFKCVYIIIFKWLNILSSSVLIPSTLNITDINAQKCFLTSQ